jgi:uncharacterized membrane protein
LRAERNARAAALACVVALGCVLALWHVARYSGGTAMLALVVLLTPLALPGYGLLARQRRPVVLGTLLIAPYLAYGLMETFANAGARAYAFASLGASALLFLSLIAWLRTHRAAA